MRKILLFAYMLLLTVLTVACTQAPPNSQATPNTEATVDLLPTTLPLSNPTPVASLTTPVELIVTVSAQESTMTDTTQPTMTPEDVNNGLSMTNAVLLYYHPDGNLYRTSVAGGVSEQLTTQPLGASDDGAAAIAYRPPRVSPDGRLLALNGNWGGAAALDLTTGESIGIGRGQAMLTPSWSPDSRQLAYVTQDDRLCIYNLESEPDDCIFAPEGLLMEAVWSPAGSLIAAAVVTSPVEGSSDCCDGRVWLIDPATGEATDAAAFTTGFEYVPGEAFQWLPDGSGLAIKRADDSRSAIYRLADGSVVSLDEWIADVAPDGGIVLHPSGALSAINGTALSPLPGTDDCAEFLNIAHAWSPDGRLAYTLMCGIDGAPLDGANLLTVIEPATGAIIRQAELPAGLFPVAWSPDGNAILLDDGAVDSPIWQLAVDNPDELEVLTEDGYLIAVIP